MSGEHTIRYVQNYQAFDSGNFFFVLYAVYNRVLVLEDKVPDLNDEVIARGVPR
jgi:hypothetical protein